MRYITKQMTTEDAYDQAIIIYTRIRKALAYVSILDLLAMVKQSKSYTVTEDNENIYISFAVAKGSRPK